MKLANCVFLNCGDMEIINNLLNLRNGDSNNVLRVCQGDDEVQIRLYEVESDSMHAVDTLKAMDVLVINCLTTDLPENLGELISARKLKKTIILVPDMQSTFFDEMTKANIRADLPKAIITNFNLNDQMHFAKLQRLITDAIMQPVENIAITNTNSNESTDSVKPFKNELMLKA